MNHAFDVVVVPVVVAVVAVVVVAVVVAAVVHWTVLSAWFRSTRYQLTNGN